MARALPKEKWLHPSVQLLNIKKTYGSLVESSYTKRGKMNCIINLTPSENSDTYKIRIAYKLTDAPRAWMLDPVLMQYEEQYPHHLYGFDSAGYPQLCVYAPKYKEWSNSLDVAKTFIPWVCTWLNTYEYWLITGVWHYDAYIAGPKV